jgi:hypothetical protein
MVKPGVYYAELAGDVLEKQSKFDEDKIYYQAPLLLTPKGGGEPVRFIWSFQPDAETWTDALLAIGGRRNAAGGVDAPARPEGRRFVITIVKYASKDGKERRLVASAEPVDGAAIAEDPAQDGPDPLDEAVHHKGPGSDDDVPF